MAKVRAKTHYPAVILIEETKVKIEVRRLAYGDFLAFEATYLDLSNQDPEVMSGPDAVRKYQELKAWTHDVLVTNLQIPDGELEDVDGTPIITGEDFLRVYGSQHDLTMDVVNEIWAMNRASDAVKKKLNARFDSAPSSAASPTVAVGLTLEPTVGSAETPASVEIGAATPGLESATKLCGVTID